MAVTQIHHYIDVIMTTMASQITSLTVVYSTVYSDADQRKHQSSASLAFVWGIHRDRWIPRTKGQLRGKCFHLMTSSWQCYRIFLVWGNGNLTVSTCSFRFEPGSLASPGNVPKSEISPFIPRNGAGTSGVIIALTETRAYTRICRV